MGSAFLAKVRGASAAGGGGSPVPGKIREGGESRPTPRGWERDSAGSACPPLEGSSVPPLPSGSPPRSLVTLFWLFALPCQQQAVRLGPCRGAQLGARSLPLAGCGGGKSGSPGWGPGWGSVTPHPSALGAPSRGWGQQGCALRPVGAALGGPGLGGGEGVLGPGGVGGAALAPALPAAGERKPAASSAVPRTRVLLLLLPSAAAALLLHPIIVRGGCEKKNTHTNPQTGTEPNQHTQAAPPPEVSPLPPVGGTPRTGCASLALGRGGRAGEAEGGGGRGQADTGKIAFVSGTASGAGARCCGCRSPPLTAPLPQAQRRHRAGERAQRRLLIYYYYFYSFFFFSSPSLSRSRDFSLFGAEDPPSRTHAAPRPRFPWVQPESAPLPGLPPPKLGSMSGKVIKPKEEKDASKGKAGAAAPRNSVVPGPTLPLRLAAPSP